jgi:ABC-type oligopeptide transport system ATPase subunit
LPLAATPTNSPAASASIARALILEPKLIVADEPVSALDVFVGAQVLLLLQEPQREFALTYVFISHSLPVVAQVATRTAVIRAGQFLEVGSPNKSSTIQQTTKLENCSPPSPNSPALKRFLLISFFSCFLALDLQLSTVNFLFPALESPH